MNIDEYLAGIIRSAERGMITYARPEYEFFGTRTDAFTHIPGSAFNGYIAPMQGALTARNTRRLDPHTKEIIRQLCSRGAVTMLEIGSGAGVAAAEAAALGCTVDSIARTPTNPFVAFRVEKAEDFITQTILENGSVYRARDGERYVQTDDILAQGAGKFTVHTTPFLRKQYIGDFPGEIRPEGTYDIIYERYGPIYHAENPARLLAEAAHHVAPAGMLVIAAFRRELIKKSSIPQGMCVFGEKKCSRTVLFTRGAPSFLEAAADTWERWS